MIVKVQRSLFPWEMPEGHQPLVDELKAIGARDVMEGPDPQATALIYNEGRHVEQEVPYKEVFHYFTGNEMKIYCEAKYRNGKFRLIRRTHDRPW